VFEVECCPRYYEVDQQGVVFNMWYLGYFDEAWAAFMASLGRSYPQLLADGDDVMLVRTEVDWSQGLRFGERATIEVGVERLGRTSFTLRYDLRRDGTMICRARTVYVMVGTDGSGKKDVPPDLRAGMEQHRVEPLPGA
jgi:acyl-CoA thioester hydrolase